MRLTIIALFGAVLAFATPALASSTPNHRIDATFSHARRIANALPIAIGPFLPNPHDDHAVTAPLAPEAQRYVLRGFLLSHGGLKYGLNSETAKSWPIKNGSVTIYTNGHGELCMDMVILFRPPGYSRDVGLRARGLFSDVLGKYLDYLDGRGSLAAIAQ